MATTRKNAKNATDDGYIHDLDEAIDAQAKAWPARKVELTEAQTKAANIFCQAARYQMAYQQAKTEFAARFATNPAEAIAWAGEEMTIAQTQFELVHHYNLLPPCDDAFRLFREEWIGEPAEDVLVRAAEMLDRAARELLNRSIGRATSTGHFHNASDHAKAEGYARTLRDLAGFCPGLKDVATLVRF